MVFAAALLLAFQPAHAQSDRPLAIVINADGVIMPPMQEYILRGLNVANQRGADLVIIQLDTPGGDGESMLNIMQAIRNSEVPVVVFVAPSGAQAASAGAMITMSGRISAMAPETVIGASSPVSSSGENLDSTMEAKAKNDIKAAIRPMVSPRGERALTLAESMIDEAVAVSSDEALDTGLIDFIARDLDDLLAKLDGFTVEMPDGSRTLHTANARTEPLSMSFVEELLIVISDPNIISILLSVGSLAIYFEFAQPGGWVSGFIGVVCIALAIYGGGALSLDWFGAIFLVLAFVLFILDIKAPTHGALTAAGVASFIFGMLVLFNSPSLPAFQPRVSVPLVVTTGLIMGGLVFAVMLMALRVLHAPIRAGVESLTGKIGSVRAWEGTSGQVQLESELWSAEAFNESEKIHKGDTVEVVEVKGLRLKVRKK